MLGDILVACHCEERDGTVILSDEDGLFPLSDKTVPYQYGPYREYLAINPKTKKSDKINVLKALSAEKSSEYRIQSISYVDIGSDCGSTEYRNTAGVPVKQYSSWDKIADESMDTVYAMHCDSGINKSIADIYRVLKPGGNFVVIGNKLTNTGSFNKGKGNPVLYNDLQQIGIPVLMNMGHILQYVDFGKPILVPLIAFSYIKTVSHYLYSKSKSATTKQATDIYTELDNRVELVDKPVKSCPEGKEINPKTGNCVNKCSPDQVRNPETGRCVNGAKTTRKAKPTSAECPEGKEVNPKTGKCVNKCSPDQVRNPETGRCVKGTNTTKKAKCPKGKEINPKTGNCVNKCPSGQVRNPETGRCVNGAKTTKKNKADAASAQCPEGKELNPKTGKCINKCKPDQVRNPETGRCVKMNAPEPAKARTPTPEPAKARTPTPEPAKARTPTPEPTKARTPTPEPVSSGIVRLHKGNDELALEYRKTLQRMDDEDLEKIRQGKYELDASRWKPRVNQKYRIDEQPAKAKTPSPERTKGPVQYLIFHSKSKDFEQYGLPKDTMRRFSNFSNDSVEYNGHVYPTAEHAYQAQKYAFIGRPDLVKQFWDGTIKSANDAKSAGGKGGMKKNGVSMTPEQLNAFIAANDQIMQDIVESKVKRNPDIKQILKVLREHNVNLVHHSRTDMVWGAHANKDGTGILRGQNKLGEFYNNLKL